MAATQTSGYAFGKGQDGVVKTTPGGFGSEGNFGSIEGDGAAAMRYTEARLTKFTQEVCLADLDKDVVDFGPNFDETEKEPLVLPMLSCQTCPWPCNLADPQWREIYFLPMYPI